MLFSLIFLAFTIPSVVISFDETNRFCVIPRCTIGTHTMCLYTLDRPNNICGRIVRLGLRDVEKRVILRMHNHFRRKVYTGGEERGNPGPQPAATRIELLEWDNELAQIAQRWSQQCIIMNDVCRNVEDYSVGQNYIFNDYDEDMTPQMEARNMLRLVRKWYREVRRFNRNFVRSYSAAEAANTTTFRYTQMVWGNTIKIGCGATVFHKYRYPVPKIFLVCNYGPAGNREGQPVYEIAAGEYFQDFIVNSI